MVKKLKNKPSLFRKKYSEDEAKYQWLSMLLDAYHVNNWGTSKELKLEIQKRKQKPACHKSCHNCCLRPEAPISEIELNGISWFVSEKIDDKELRSQLKTQLINHEETTRCPFLIFEVCSIYPLRPIACREFFVFGKPCDVDEQIIETRREDVWSPSRNTARKTAFKILPYYGFNSEADKLKAYEDGFIHRKSMPMHSCDWKRMVETMEMFE